MREEAALPLPAARCLNKEQAADYLGIGVTLLSELGVPFIKLGRRCLYDKLDLDTWLDEYKSREQGRAGKEKTLWPVKLESTGERILATGGLTQPSRTASEYVKALGLKAERKPKRC
ncbi:hypothetical protein [Thiobacillus sedimenti]|uniref:Helix-turn-helix domain-containing protein n=1 Tax=Thiobacillus sedimenti TaxID=3110231 RepID=A0ABZ1CMY1_9PROT|nr:hypothetical protein [Thiobacillus sp. SCUT-2]WRS40753.1 hypothetical protein VA613_00490 [Thiobacillus sp. SCUT-2]